MPSAFHIGYLAALKSSAEKGNCKHSPLICAPFAHADRTNAVLTGGIHPRLIQLTSHLQMAARMQPVLPRLPTNILPAPCWPTSFFFFFFFSTRVFVFTVVFHHCSCSHTMQMRNLGLQPTHCLRLAIYWIRAVVGFNVLWSRASGEDETTGNGKHKPYFFTELR